MTDGTFITLAIILSSVAIGISVGSLLVSRHYSRKLSRIYLSRTRRLIERHTPAGINRYPDEDGT